MQDLPKAKMDKQQHFAALEPTQQTQEDLRQYQFAEEVFSGSSAPLSARIETFARYCSRPSLSRFISRYEVFKRILGVHGSIVECGVFHGAGLFSFAKISSILEPTNHSRKIVGFDTFDGFPSVADVDVRGGATVVTEGGCRGSPEEDLLMAVKLFDYNRPLSHIRKVELVPGDFCETAPKYVKENPHLVVSLLNLDLDLYEPTKTAIETFVPLMPKGAIIIFDELNAPKLPGETKAVHEMLRLSSLRIERFPHDTYFSFAVIE